ncbi:MAG: hypothetical protein PUA61_08285 [Succinatimonas hippei]|nr:hypothetical protein [Succinatimonas hippei]
MTEKYLLRKEEVAEFLNISERTLGQIRADKSRGFPEPARVMQSDKSPSMWRRSDVQAWADELFEKGA